MARCISIVNQKGGVGKTTTAINLASSLAVLRQHVLLIDMDPQGNATSGIGLTVTPDQPSMYEVLMNEQSLATAIVETAQARLSIAPATMDLAGANVELIHADQREFRLRSAIETVAHQYDYILIDCPPSLGILTINSIVAGDEVLIPVQTEYFALEGLGQLLQTLELIQAHLQPGLQVLGAVLTMYDRRNRLAQAVFRDMYQHFPYQVFRAVIPRNVRLAEAPSYGKPITTYARSSKGARAYLKLARELLVSRPQARKPAPLTPKPDIPPLPPLDSE
jgi:chromosome partitioning protein